MNICHVLLKTTLCPCGIMAVRRKSAHFLTYCKPAPGHAAATGRFLLVAKAIFSISLSFTNIPWFLRVSSGWTVRTDLILIDQQSSSYLIRKSKFPAALPLRNPYAPALKLLTLLAFCTVLLWALLPTVSLSACLQHLCACLVPQSANESRVVPTSLRTSS